MALVSMINFLMKRKVWMSCQNANHLSHWCHSNSENKKIQRLKVTVFSKIMFSFQPNKLGQIYVKWNIKTQILRYVSACSFGRKTYCTKYTLCCVMQYVCKVDRPRGSVALTQLGFPFVSWQGSDGSGAMRHTNAHCRSTFLPAQNPPRPDLQQMGAFFILRRGADNPW